MSGIQLIHAAATDVAFPNNTVLIAGIDGLSKSDYEAAIEVLGERAAVNADNHPDRIEEDKWVNCGIAWVKDQAGAVRI